MYFKFNKRVAEQLFIFTFNNKVIGIKNANERIHRCETPFHKTIRNFSTKNRPTQTHFEKKMGRLGKYEKMKEEYANNAVDKTADSQKVRTPPYLFSSEFPRFCYQHKKKERTHGELRNEAFFKNA